MICFHHNDLDGRCAGAMVSRYMDCRKPECFIEVDYVKVPDASMIKRGEDVFIVDYCYTKATVSQLEAIIEKAGHVVWIDHHKSSSDLLLDTSDYDFLSDDKLKIVVDTKLCGAALTFMYFEYESGHHMPRFLRYVDDWDRWAKRYPESYKFKLGMDSIDHSPTNQIWRDLMFDADVTERVLQYGDIIEDYVTSHNTEYRNQFAFKCIVNGLKCYALNLKENSKAFGDLVNQCDAVVTFVFNGTSYQYSIYSTNKEIDCSKVAECYGGGGHPGAAGFECDTLILERADW